MSWIKYWYLKKLRTLRWERKADDENSQWQYQCLRNSCYNKGREDEKFWSNRWIMIMQMLRMVNDGTLMKGNDIGRNIFLFAFNQKKE